MKFHPLAELFPLMQGREFDDLVIDIENHGQREPIIVHEGMILDGRNRWRACEAAGREPITAPFTGDNPLQFVISLNLHRRHMSESQRAIVAARISGLRRGGDRRSDQTANWQFETRAKAAELLNVGERTVNRARRVVDGGTPELVKAVERGEVSVSAAAQVASLPKEQQADLVARGEDEIVKAANRIKRERKEQQREQKKAKVAELAATVPPRTERYEIRLGACIDLVNTAPNSVDCIITDPPYPAEFLPVYSDLSKVAAHALKQGGSLVVMVGQSYLAEVLARLSEQMTYHWCCAYMSPGGMSPISATVHKRVNTFWKPLLWFTKGQYAGPHIGDVMKSPVNNNDKRFHHWGQSEAGMADIVERFTMPNDLVMDPFMGAGTTGVVCVDLGRRFLGVDTDRTAYETTLARLAKPGAA